MTEINCLLREPSNRNRFLEVSPICRHSCLAPNSPYLAHLLYLWYCATRADLEHRTIFTCIHSEIRIMIRHSDLLNSDKNLLFQQSFHVWKSQLIKFDNGPYLFGNGVVKFLMWRCIERPIHHYHLSM